MISDTKTAEGFVLATEIKHVGIYAVSQIVSRFGGYILLPVFWQKLRPVDYGIIALTEVIAGFFLPVCGLLVDQSLTRFYHEWAESTRPKAIGTIWIVHWVSSIVLGASVLLLLWFVTESAFPSVAFYPYVFWAVVSAVLGNLSQVLFALYRIQQKSSVFAGFSLLKFALQTVLTLVLVFKSNDGVAGYLLGNAIAGATMAIVCTCCLKQFARLEFDRTIAMQCCRFSLPLIPTAISGSFGLACERLLLQSFLSLDALGIYMISSKFSQAVLGIHDVIKFSWGPFVYKNIARSGGVEAVAKTVSYYIYPIVIVSLGVVLFTDDFVLLAGRTEYQQVGWFAPLLVPSTLISSMYVYTAPGIILSGRTSWSLVPTVVQFVALFGMALVLIPRIGIYGLVVAKIVASLFFFASHTYLSRRLYPCWPSAKTLLWVNIVVVVVSVFAMWGMANMGQWQNLGLSLLCFAALSVLLWLYTRIMPVSEGKEVLASGT